MWWVRVNRQTVRETMGFEKRQLSLSFFYKAYHTLGVHPRAQVFSDFAQPPPTQDTHRGGNGKPLPCRTAGAAWVAISSAAASGDIDVA